MKLGSPSGPPLGFFGHLTAVPLQGSSPSCQEGTSSVVPRGPSVSEKGWSTNGIYVSVCMCTSVHTHPYIHTYIQTDRQTCHAMPCHAMPYHYITLHYITFHTSMHAYIHSSIHTLHTLHTLHALHALHTLHAMPCHAMPYPTNQPSIHTSHYITYHTIPLHCIILHYITVQYSTLQYITVQYIHTCTVHIYIHT